MDYAVKLENRNTRRLLESFVGHADQDLSLHLTRKSLVSDVTASIWCQAVRRSLAVTTGFDAVQALSGSLLASFAMNQQIGSYLFIQRFLEFDPCLEFRVFVSKRRVTGISQVNAIYSTWLSAHATELQDRILSLLNLDIIPHFSEQESYCVDLVAFPARNKSLPARPSYGYHSYPREHQSSSSPSSNSNLDILVLRIHPFLPRAVNGLFEWGKDKDALAEGPTQFRYKREPTFSSALHYEPGSPLIARYWLEVMNDEALGQLNWKRRSRAARIALLGTLLLLCFVYLFLV